MYTNSYYSESSDSKERKLFGKSAIANVINVIAIITFAWGLALGIAMIIVLCATGLASLLWLAFIMWGFTGVSGFMMMGFAKVINLLTDIRDNQLNK